MTNDAILRKGLLLDPPPLSDLNAPEPRPEQHCWRAVHCESPDTGASCVDFNMAGVTFEELIDYVGISADELNKPCSDEHITSIALFLANWQTVAPLLGLSETDEEDVEEEGKKTQDKRYKTLRRWKDKNLFKATYRVLVDVFLQLGKANLAEKVCRLLVEGT